MAGAASSSPLPNQQEPPTSSTPVRVIIADSNAIFRVGVRKVLGVEDDICVVAQAETLEQVLQAVSKAAADVLLLGAGISPDMHEMVSEVSKRAPGLKVVLFAGELPPEDTVEYLRRGVRGIVDPAITPDLLVRCVRKIAEGETWLDNRGVNWVIEAYRTQTSTAGSARPKNRLNDKELLIVTGVTQGLRNKEIAAQIGTTEQVVKNYLRKVYDKLGVADRLELALYCIHNRMLRKGETAEAAESAEGQAAGGAQ
jgi:DNA-binding NarL/FixJ family response regulator